MRRILFVLCLLLIPSIGSAQTWPKRGVFQTKGCEVLCSVLDPVFSGLEEEAAKTGEKYKVTAKVCVNGTLHVRTTLVLKDGQTLVETDIYSTFRFTGKKTKEGKPIVEIDLKAARVIDITDFPSESAEKELPKGSERF